MKSVFAMLLVVFVLSACSSPAPIPTSTLAPSPTMTLTKTPVPTLTPTSTSTPEGVIAGMDVTQYGFDVGELVQKGNEIVYAETGDLAAKKDAKGVMRFVYGPELIEHLHKVAKLGEMRNGNIHYDPKVQDHMQAVASKIRAGQYDELIIRKPNGYIESYSMAWVKSDNGEDLYNNDPHDVTIWIEPPTHEGDDPGCLIEIRISNWINATQY